jgi:hypothetical protein
MAIIPQQYVDDRTLHSSIGIPSTDDPKRAQMAKAQTSAIQCQVKNHSAKKISKARAKPKMYLI